MMFDYIGFLDYKDKLKIFILSNYTTIEIGEYIHFVHEQIKHWYSISVFQCVALYVKQF